MCRRWRATQPLPLMCAHPKSPRRWGEALQYGSVRSLGRADPSTARAHGGTSLHALMQSAHNPVLFLSIKKYRICCSAECICLLHPHSISFPAMGTADIEVLEPRCCLPVLPIQPSEMTAAGRKRIIKAHRLCSHCNHILDPPPTKMVHLLCKESSGSETALWESQGVLLLNPLPSSP